METQYAHFSLLSQAQLDLPEGKDKTMKIFKQELKLSCDSKISMLNIIMNACNRRRNKHYHAIFLNDIIQ